VKKKNDPRMWSAPGDRLNIFLSAFPPAVSSQVSGFFALFRLF